jgi:hypothetical protein
MNRTELASNWPPTASIARKAGHKQMSPLEAIRLKCLDCCCYQPSEVRLCEAVTCALWPFRAGKHPYTKRRLQEADFGATQGDPMLMPQDSPSEKMRPQEASFDRRGPTPGATQAVGASIDEEH